MGLSFVSGMGRMFKNCLNSMTNIISNHAGRLLGVSLPKRLNHLANPLKSEAKVEQEITGLFFKLLHVKWSGSMLFSLLMSEREREGVTSGTINPDDLVLYTVSLIKSLHRLIMCKEPWHQLLYCSLSLEKSDLSAVRDTFVEWKLVAFKGSLSYSGGFCGKIVTD